LRVVRAGRQGLLRWPELALRTLKLLFRRKPAILFVQNPSLVLTTLVILTRRLFGYYLVVDAHNEGVRPFARRGRFVRWLTRRALSRADATIVTNTALAKDVKAEGGRPLVLPDRLPEPVLQARTQVEHERPLLVVISSFHPDEPVAAIIAAATMLPDVHFAFTGDARRFPCKGAVLPRNVQLTGYLTEKAFWRLLSQATVVCDLTLKPDCIVCGAYEALALAKPMVLSDNPATREIFGSAAVLTDNGPKSIARAVRTAVKRRNRLGANARALREEYPAPWETRAATAWHAICDGAMASSRGLV
jgi:glycosyltransferase involved in cell wall biosynthesis